MVPDGYLQRHFYQYPVNDYDSAVPGGAHLAHLDSNHGVFCADAADGNGLFLYTVSVIYTESPQVKRIMAVGIIPGAFYAVIVLSNPFNRLLFDINRSDGYTRGPLIPVTYLIFYAYCLASIALTLVNYKRIDRKIYRILAAFPILAVAVIIIQEMYRGGSCQARLQPALFLLYICICRTSRFPLIT